MTKKGGGFILALLLGLWGPASWGGKLDEFEDDLAEPAGKRAEQTEPEPAHDGGGALYHADAEGGHCDASLGECLAFDAFGALLEITGLVIVEGGRQSYLRIAPGGPAPALAPRQPGEPLTSFVRLDGHYQWADSGVSAVDLRLEGGYGFIAGQVRRTRYREEGTADELEVRYAHLLYRMRFGEAVGVNFGLGRAWVEGSGTLDGSSVTVPVLFHFSPGFGVEASYTSSHVNGHRLLDREVALLLNRDPAAITLGYRSVETPSSSLHGPFAGFSVRW